jgi:peptidoglycan/LPS O-acetylase OafA/YrhL
MSDNRHSVKLNLNRGKTAPCRVFRMAATVNNYILELSNLYIARLLSLPCFLLMVPIAHVSFKYVESPFLKWRTRYTRNGPVSS